MTSSPFEPIALRVEGLACAKGDRVLFQGATFSAAGGDLVELVGPNGSGKTTLLRVLAGLGRPHKGSAAYRIGDQTDGDPAEYAHYLSHQDGVKPTLGVLSQLQFWGDVWGAPKGASEDALDHVGLWGARRLVARALSAGQKRRLALARLLVKPRPVWVLDEPTAALDRAGRSLLGDLVAGHRSAGGMIIAASHDPLPLTPDQRIEIAPTPSPAAAA